MKKIICGLIVFLCMYPAILPAACLFGSKKQTVVSLQTTKGEIMVILFDDTPVHRDNFLENVRKGRYDGVLFHRVIDNFMIQSGDFNSVKAAAGEELGDDQVNYRLPPEFPAPPHYHRRGALCAARESDDVNPRKLSSPAQFYIVTRGPFEPAKLDSIAAARHLALTPEQREIYTTVGGTPHLDGNYTVFGEVVSGMEVADSIQVVATDSKDRPLDDVRIIRAKVCKRSARGRIKEEPGRNISE